MSQLHMPQNANAAYTLKQFQDLANQSQDNQELRIRKSNQELSNTPLGIISRHGVIHTASNVQVNQTFLHVITTDKRYRCVADQLRKALGTTMLLTEALTPAKVKSAVATADTLLKTYQEGSRLAGVMSDHGIIPNMMTGEFASFYVTYCNDNPDSKPDFRDFGDPSQLTQEQQGQGDFQRQEALRHADHERLENLGDMFREFFSQGNRLQRSGFYRFLPSDCGNDGQKAQKLNSLFAKASEDCPPSGQCAEP